MISQYIQFDLAIGVSAGGFIAALYATGLIGTIPPHTILDYITRLFEETPIIPIDCSVFGGSTKSAILHEIFGDLKMSDVTKCNFAVVVDTIRGTPIIFQSWSHRHRDIPIYEILDATSAIPLVFPPVRIRGVQCVDGGALANTPITISYLLGKLRFGTDDFVLVSIGTSNSLSSVDNQTSVSGIVSLLQSGWHTRLITRGPVVENSLVQLILGTRFIRVTDIIDGSPVDTRILGTCEELAATRCSVLLPRIRELACLCTPSLEK